MRVMQEGLLDVDIERIVNNDSGVGGDTFTVVLSSPTADMPLVFLQNVQWKRDYNGSTTDDIRVMFEIDGADYRNHVHYYKDHLEMTIIRKKYNDVIFSTHRYKVFIVKNTGDTQITAMKFMTDAELSSHTPISMEVQCIDRDHYSINDITTQGVYQDATLEDAVMAELTEMTKAIDYGEGKPNIKFDIVPFDNTNKYGHVIIPTGTKILSLPTFLQENDSYGVYNASIGTYIQEFEGKKYLWIYPLFDVKQYDKRDYVAMIFIGRNKRYGKDGNTCMLDGKVLKIVPEAEFGIMDNGTNAMNSTGNAISYGNPDNVHRSFGDNRDGGLKVKAATNVKTESTREMPDGTINTKWLGTINNAYKYRSLTIRNMMSIYQFRWYNGDIDLIYPGMPVALVMEDVNNQITKQYGIIQSTAQDYYNDSKVTHVVLNIAVMSEDVFKDMKDYDTNISTQNLKR